MSFVFSVLIADDSKPICSLVKSVVEGIAPGISIVIAGDGEAAYEAYCEHLPNLILIDNEMPFRSGIECTEMIRKIRTEFPPRILMISSVAEKEARLAAYKAGVDDYILKPFEKLELMEKVSLSKKLLHMEYILRIDNQKLKSMVGSLDLELAKSEQLALVGRNLAGIVHNLNTPLTLIKTGIELAQKGVDPEKFLNIAQNGTKQMEQIIETILGVGKKSSDLESTPQDINQILREYFEVQRVSKDFMDIDLQVQLKEVPKISGQYAQLSQVFSNIVNNALDAMENCTNKFLKVSTETRGLEIFVTFEDSGMGMSEDIQAKIFEPFFSTKLSEKSSRPSGTGLGMAYCKRILESYGGSINVNSTIGMGTKFSLVFPVKS